MFKTANVTVMVQDIDKAFAFYTKALGLSAGMRHGNNYAEVKAPGVTIGLHPDSRSKTHIPKRSKDSNLSIGFQVDKLNESMEILEKCGIIFTHRQKNEANKFAFFSDPVRTPPK